MKGSLQKYKKIADNGTHEAWGNAYGHLVVGKIDIKDKQGNIVETVDSLRDAIAVLS